MISIVRQGDHRYTVYRSGQDIGCVTVSNNPYHNRHCYLKLGLDQYDPAIAKELFSLLREELGQPLQIMLYSTHEMYEFLIRGGFARRRRCYEIEVSSADLAEPLRPSAKLQVARKGSRLYDVCCFLLYDYYRETHEAVSPLTAPPDRFCSDLPQTVVYCAGEDKPAHYAFIEPEDTGYEIAYVGTADPAGFAGFAEALAHRLLRTGGSITMECDDTDPAAMALKALFRVPHDVSFDTYVHK